LRETICNFFLFVLWRQRAERDEKEKLTEKKLIRTDHARGELAIRERRGEFKFFKWASVQQSFEGTRILSISKEMERSRLMFS
jgi:hypothetical protein